MVKLVKCTAKADRYALSYKVPTDQLTCTGDGADDGQWTYAVDLRVNEQLDYPDIPPSTWTVTLNIAHKQRQHGQVVASVRPKEHPSELKSPRGDDVMVDCRIRSYPGGVWADFQIGKSGYVTATDHNDLRGLADGNRKSRYKLRQGTHMLVELTFHVKRRSIQTDINEIYDTGMFTDCSLVCQGQAFRVHRAIVAVQSPVLKTMFNTSPGYARYFINDVRREELAAMINYAYTRAPLDDRVNLEKLLMAAKKYGIGQLLDECEFEMVRDVKADSASHYQKFAEEHGLVKLRTAAAKFIADHPELKFKCKY